MSIQKTARHVSALAYAAAGIPVFPCVVGGKTPATPNGFHDASADASVIDAWWAQADYNLGLSPEDAGWCVVDPDMGGGKDGEATLRALAAEHGTLPLTRTVRTPGGGRHLYFEGTLPSTQGNLNKGLGPAVDTRGRGGYVLVPPSIVDGKPYEVLDDSPISELPAWIAARVHRSVEHHAAPHGAVEDGATLLRARSRLLDLVGRKDVAVEGRGGDTRTFQLACELLDMGVSQEVAVSLLDEIWNPHCVPPWSLEGLGVKVQNASNHKQNEGAAWAVAPPAEAFAGTALDKLLAESKQVARRSRFHMESEDEQELGADPSWLIPELIPENSTVLMVGPSGSYKSFIALDLALSISTATDAFGTKPLQTGPVFYAAAEGRSNIKKARRRAWKLARGVDATPDFFVGPAPMLALPEEVQEFGEEIKRRCDGRKPRLIVLDTVAKIMAGMNENDASDAGKFIRFCDSLVEGFPGASVVALHHTGKDAARGARGSSAFLAGFDSVIELTAHRAAKALEVWVRKHKDAEERATPFTFEGKHVGQSLVFQPTTPEAHKALVGKGDALDKHAVGAALQAMKAVGQDNAVTSYTLAGELVKGERDNAARLVRQEKTERALRALARSTLKAYGVGAGKDLTWFLPSPA